MSKIQVNSEYAQRINRVIDHLRQKLDRPVKLEQLARVACLSPFHFHRIFRAVSGETLNNFTNRLRVEKAARLLRHSGRSLTDIAFDCGFSSPATFSRAFRSGYDTSPRQFRKSGEIQNSKICKELFSGQGYLLSMTDEEKRAAFPVRLIDVPERQVAYIRVANAFETERVIAAFRTMIEWANPKVSSRKERFSECRSTIHTSRQNIFIDTRFVWLVSPLRVHEENVEIENAGHAVCRHQGVGRNP